MDADPLEESAEKLAGKAELAKIKSDFDDAKAGVGSLRSRMGKELKAIGLIKQRLKAKGQPWADSAHDMISDEAGKQLKA